ncbi:MAG: helix-turn-helix domain-containing protein [Acutalibacteraceae bacterium]
MEKKTIGQFICTLRKASGMTQKQLAQKLCVSDKSVSRWERDECLPDLTLIPVIAEIFGVTSDEILKGEKNNPEKQPDEEAFSKKSRKMLEQMLKSTKTNFIIQSIIAIGIALTAPVFQWAITYSFGRTDLGTGIGLVLCIIALMLELVFTILTFSKIGGDESDEMQTVQAKKSFYKISELSFSFIFCLLVMLIPLMINCDVLLYYLAFGAVAALLCVLVSWLVNIRAVKKGKIYIPQEEKEHFVFISSLQKKHLFAFIIACAAALLLVQLPFNIFLEPVDFAKGQTFTTGSDFVTYMEQKKYQEYLEYGGSEEEFDPYFDGVDSIENSSEKTVLTFPFDDDIVQLKYEWNEDETELTSITVYTVDNLNQGHKTMKMINIAWCSVYLIIAIADYAFYRKKLKDKEKENH